MDTEVSQKIRMAIKAKLVELGMHVDEELPDYVMVLVANRRSKSQMEQDLNLFLGDNTPSFTSWLNEVLKKLEAVSANLPLPNRKPSSEGVGKAGETEEKDKAKKSSKKKGGSKSKGKEAADPGTPKKSTKRKHEEKEEKSKKKKSESSPTAAPPPPKVEEKEKVAFSLKPTSKLSKSTIAYEEDVVKRAPLKSLTPPPEKKKKPPPASSEVKEPEKEVVASQNTEPEDVLNLKADADEFSIEEEKDKSILEGSSSKENEPTVVKEEESSAKELEMLRQSALLTQRKNSTEKRSPPVPISPPKNEKDDEEEEEQPRPRLRSRIGYVSQIRDIILSNAERQRSQISDRPHLRMTERLREMERDRGRNMDRFGIRRNRDETDRDSMRRNRDDDRRSSRLVTVDRRGRSPSPIRIRRRSGIRPISLSHSRSRSRSPIRAKDEPKGGLKSSVRRVYHDPGHNDEEYDPLKPEVGSIPERSERPKRKEARKSGKNILMQAMEDAQKSVVSRSYQSKVLEAERNEKLEADGFKRKVRMEGDEEPSEGKRRSVKSRLGTRKVQLTRPGYDEDSVENLESFKQNDDLITIRINTSSASKHRKVHMESIDKAGPKTRSSSSASPQKRFSIKVKNSDDESTDEEEEKAAAAESKNKGGEKVVNSAEDLDEVFEEIVEYEIDDEDDFEREEIVVSEEDSQSENKGKYSKVAEVPEGEVDEEEEIIEEEEIEMGVGDVSDLQLPEPESTKVVRKTRELSESPDKVKIAKLIKNNAPTSFVSTPPSSSNNSSYQQHMYNHPQREYQPNQPHSSIHFRGEDSILSSDLPLFRTISNTDTFNNDNSYPSSLARTHPVPTSGPYAKSPFLPITGNPQSGGVGAPGMCKYWPNCTFKEKCTFPHPKCKFGANCTKADCPYGHPFKPPKAKESKPEEIVCKFFPKCTSMSCTFFHPTPCRFGVGCTDGKCKNFHPGKTTSQVRKEKSSFFSVGSRSYTKPPATHLLKWVKTPATPTPSESK